MTAQDLARFQRKRLEPFRGLVVDVPVWSEAHNYHRDQVKLHAMSAHQRGVVSGLEVVAWNPPDYSVVIYPGVAIDQEGNTIVLPQLQRFYIKTEEKGTAIITIGYSEIAPDVAAKTSADKTQPLYTTEAYRLEEQRRLPAEPYIELARVDIGDESPAIRDAANPYQPAHNEIDTRYRTISGAKPAGEITIGLLCYSAGDSGAAWRSHHEGVLNLVHSIRQNTDYAARLLEPIELKAEIVDCDLLVMTGYGEFQLSDGERRILTNYLKRGGVLFAEACAGTPGDRQELVTAFRSSFARLCDQLGRPLKVLERGHPVFHSCYTFGSPPPGHDGEAAVLGDESIIFSDADYGCVWQGCRSGQPLSRQVIRDATEFGVNMAAYSHQRLRLQAIRIVGQ